MQTENSTLRELFDAAQDLDAAARAQFLARLPAAPRAELERLLAADAQAGDGVLAADPAYLADMLGEPDAPTLPAAGQRIGAWQLLALLGEGGSSTVFRAVREHAGVRQEAALKLLRRGLYTADAQRQFRRERQALAQLQHPDVASLIEGGVTESGLAYIVLEFVDGVPITDYARAHALDLPARLRLFLRVCRAVEAAHRALIVHRDLKPSNVLVSAEGHVKLLDFGIAKLLDADDETQTRLPSFTPAYAAPEQRSGAAITTATDVYALGVMLGELVTGKRITSGHTLSSQVDADSAPGVLPAPPHITRRLLRGDIDNIVLKAADEEPERRYPSASAFCDDIERLLEGRPVTAHPPSRLYRAQKFISRHRSGVTATVLFALALIALSGVALWQAQRARTQEQRAVATQAFLVDVFRSNSSSQPDPVKARQTTARQLLDIGAARIDGALQGAPEGKLELLRLFGGLYDDLSLYDEAVPLRRRAVEMARAIHGAGSDENAGALLDLAGSLNASSSARELGSVLAQAGAILDAHDDDASPLRGVLLRKLSVLYQDTDVPRAVDYAQKSVQVFAKLHDAGEQAETLSNLGWLQDHAGAHLEAAATLQRALDLAATTGAHAQDLPRYRAYLSDAQFSALDLAGAETNARAALKGILAINGDEPADTAYFQMRLGKQLARTGRPQEAVDVLTKAKAVAARSDSIEQPMWAQFMLGDALVRIGDAAQGLAEIDSAIAACRASQPDVVFLASWLEARAAALIELGRHDDAQTTLEESRQIHERHDEGSATDAGATNTLARARAALARGAVDAAQTLLDGVGDTQRPLTWIGIERALLGADIALAQGRTQLAAQQAAQIRARIEQAGLTKYLPAQLADADLAAGRAALAEGHSDAARPLLQSALALRQRALLPSSPVLESLRSELARVPAAL